MHDATRERFARTAERVAELQDARAAELEQQVVRFVAPAGDERALDSGTGAGALAFALAPHVREVVAVDLVPELLLFKGGRWPGQARRVERRRLRRHQCVAKQRNQENGGHQDRQLHNSQTDFASGGCRRDAEPEKFRALGTAGGSARATEQT